MRPTAKASGAAHETVDGIAGEAKRTAATLGGKNGRLKEPDSMQTIDRASRSAHEAVDRIASATHQAADALGEKGQRMKNAEQRLVEDCRLYVRERPIAALAISAAAGFLLSRLLGPSSDHRTS